MFLISLLLSLYRGWDEKVGGFVENSNVDVWAGALGTDDFLTANSIRLCYWGGANARLWASRLRLRPAVRHACPLAGCDGRIRRHGIDVGHRRICACPAACVQGVMVTANGHAILDPAIALISHLRTQKRRAPS